MLNLINARKKNSIVNFFDKLASFIFRPGYRVGCVPGPRLSQCQILRTRLSYRFIPYLINI